MIPKSFSSECLSELWSLLNSSFCIQSTVEPQKSHRLADVWNSQLFLSSFLSFVESCAHEASVPLRLSVSICEYVRHRKRAFDTSLSEKPIVMWTWDGQEWWMWPPKEPASTPYPPAPLRQDPSLAYHSPKVPSRRAEERGNMELNSGAHSPQGPQSPRRRWQLREGGTTLRSPEILIN